MTAIGEALRTKLLSYSTVTSIIGQRMYPDVLEQDATLPAVIFYVTSTDREHSVTGVTKTAHARVTLDCYAKSRATASQISKAIRETGIDQFTGTINGYSFQGVEFTSGDTYEQEPPIDGNQAHRYLVSFDLLVHYSEP